MILDKGDYKLLFFFFKSSFQPLVGPRYKHCKFHLTKLQFHEYQVQSNNLTKIRKKIDFSATTVAIWLKFAYDIARTQLLKSSNWHEHPLTGDRKIEPQFLIATFKIYHRTYEINTYANKIGLRLCTERGNLNLGKNRSIFIK